MIKHIVMFKMVEFKTNTERNSKINELKDMLEALPAKINEIKEFEVGINIAQSPAAFDVVLVSEFDNLKDLDNYRIHPEHVKVVDFIRNVTVERTVVDYNI